MPPLRIPDSIRRILGEAFRARDILEPVEELSAEQGRLVESCPSLDVDTPLLGAILELKEASVAFVTSGGEVIGSITREDLQKPAARMWLFGVVTLIEQRFTNLIRRHCPGESWQAHISEGRRQKGEHLLQERLRRGQRVDLLDCVQLADKGQIVARNEEIRGGTIFTSRRQAESVIKKVEQLRNSLAHSQDIVTSDWETIVLLCEFVADKLLDDTPVSEEP